MAQDYIPNFVRQMAFCPAVLNFRAGSVKNTCLYFGHSRKRKLGILPSYRKLQLCLIKATLVLSVFLPATAYANAYDENQVVRVVAGTEAESTILIELQNLNTPDLERGVISISRGLVVPSSDPPELEIVSFKVALEEKGKIQEVDFAEFEPRHGKISTASIINYAYVGWFRGYQIGRISLTPRFDLYIDHQKRSFEITEMQARLKFPVKDSPATALAEDKYARRMLENLVLNPQASPTGNHTAVSALLQKIEAAQRWNSLLDDGIQGGPVAQFEVYREGINVVTSEMLSHAGLDLTGFSPDGFRLYTDGAEIPMALVGESEEGWSIAFAATPFPPHGVSSRSYFLLANPPETNRPPRRFVQSKDESTTGTEVTEGRQKLKLQERRKYFHKIAIDKDFSHWYFLELPPNELVSVPVNLPDINTEGADVEVRLYLGVADPKVEHQIRMYVNGEEVGLFSWSDGRNKIHQFQVPASKWRVGENDVVFEFSTDNLKNPAKALYLSRCEIDYPQSLSATDGRLVSRVTLNGPSHVRVKNLLSEFFAVNLTNANRPQLLNAIPTVEAGSYVFLMNGTGNRLLDVFTVDSASRRGECACRRAF
jgi:hypothetical protein